MTLFQYTATDDDGKPVRGSLSASDASAASDALASMNVEPTALSEATRKRGEPPRESPRSLMTTFAFEGKDAQGVVKRGTVQAESKYQAFSTIKQTQGLELVMLSPVGVTPAYKDPDLALWQRSGSAKTSSVTREPLTIQPAQEAPAAREHAKRRYAPLFQTLELYAGWLLAWYMLFIAFGHYGSERELAFEVPFVESFYRSPTISTISIALFVLIAIGALARATTGRAAS